MIFHWADKPLSYLPYFIRKPLYSCVPCMGGIYTLIHWFIAGNGLEMRLLVIMGAVIGLNEVISMFIRLIEGIENLETFDE